MSGFTENRTPGASERSEPHERVMTWHASRAMLPLVGRIARDITALHERLAVLRPEFAHLEENRRRLDWPGRRRRYQLEEEIAGLEAARRLLEDRLNTATRRAYELVDGANGGA